MQLRTVKREDFDTLLADAGRMSIAVPPGVTLRAGGAEVTPQLRDELLAKVRSGEHVELELDVLAYEQQAGSQNLKFVRLRDGAVLAAGRSGVGKPVLRDHDRNSLSVAGRITDSKAEKRGEGDYAISQTWRLTAPWAVELALRDLLSCVSASLRPTGPVLCSACNAPIFTVCYHFRGDQLAEKVGEDGKKRMVRDPGGSVVVEWVFTSAVVDETSITPTPAVTSARIEAIRAALSAHENENEGGIPPQKDEAMNPELLALLGLAATAGDSEVLSAVKALKVDATEGKIASQELAAANKELEIVNRDVRKSEVDTFISEALSAGKIAKGDETAWRELFDLSAERARNAMAKRAVACATPVGLPRQSDKNITAAGAGGAPATATGADPAAAQLTSAGIDPALAAKFATRFGAGAEPMKDIAAVLATKGAV
jgi:hypothetical protein